jgi:hypothetical protein
MMNNARESRMVIPLARLQGIALLSLLIAAAPAPAAQLEGQAFAETHEAGGSTLRLHRTALLKVKLFFKVYVAGLYLAETKDAGRVLDDVPKRLEIAYLRDIPREILIEAAEDYFRANVPPAQRAALRGRLDRINALYVDVKAGDRYALSYEPGLGCELSLNGKSLGVISGADFAAAYFGIWLGSGCAKPEFRDALLR